MSNTIAIAGLGLTGSYLACRLAQETDFEIHAFERKVPTKTKALCGWATRLREFKQFILRSNIPITPNELILYEGAQILFKIGKREITIPCPDNFIGTINKLQFQQELQSVAKEFGVKFHYGTGLYPSTATLNHYDLIIDATGFRRSLIGKTAQKDCLIHCIQHTVRYNELPMQNLRIEMYYDGYLWYFPLGKHLVHVGCGSMGLHHRRLVQQFLEKNPPDKILSSGCKPIRMIPPSACNPLTSGNIVAVGEAAGVVRPMIGEGIVPSLESANILVKAISDLDSWPQNYEQSLLSAFKLNDREWAYFQARLQRRKLACFWHALRLPMPLELHISLQQKIQIFKAM